MSKIDYTHQHIQVVLALSAATVLQEVETRPLLVLTPFHNPTWNDFGHNLWASAVLLRADGREHHFDAMVLFEGEGNSTAYILKVARNSGWVHANELSSTFCCILGRDSDYRDLMLELDFDLGISVLSTLGDIVLLNALGSTDPRLRLTDQESFHVAAMRQAQSWTAFRRARRHLRRNPPPDVDEAAYSFGMRALLPSSEEPCVIDFDLTRDELTRDRFIVLIGQNGAGKTQLLLSMIDGLRTNPSAYFAFAPGSIRFAAKREGKELRLGRPQFTRIVLFSSTPSDPYPKEIAPWDGLDYQYFSIIGESSSGDNSDALTLALLDCMRDDLRTRFADSEIKPPDDILFAPQTDRMALLKEILESVGLLSRIYLPLKDETFTVTSFLVNFEGRFYHPFKIPGGELNRLRFFQSIDLSRPAILLTDQLTPRHLSSGETAMLRFASQLVASVEQGTLFLFDEPETHLHPNYISLFAEILHKLLKRTGSIAIAATHSAYLVREVPSARVRVLRPNAGRIEVEQPRMQTYGASIDRISDTVFYNSEIRHQYQTTLAQWVATLTPGTSIEEIASRYGAEMNAETLTLVHRILRDGFDGA